MRLFILLSFLFISGSIFATNPTSTVAQESYLVAEKTVTKTDKVVKSSFFKKVTHKVQKTYKKAVTWVKSTMKKSGAGGSLITALLLLVLGIILLVLGVVLLQPWMWILATLAFLGSGIFLIVWLVKLLS